MYDGPHVGQLVRIKEIAGTRLASKRNPAWGVIVSANTHVLVDDENYRGFQVAFLHENKGCSAMRYYMVRRNFDIPTDKQVPDWVWAAIAVRALTE